MGDLSFRFPRSEFACREKEPRGRNEERGENLVPCFVHVDVRREPFRALWGRSADGRYVPIAQAVREVIGRNEEPGERRKDKA